MKYYTLTDLETASGISKATLKRRILRGELEAVRHFQGEEKISFIYMIPESELFKLGSLTLSMLVVRENLQPSINEILDDERLLAQRTFSERRNYNEYIRSEEWKAVRRERLRLDGYKCVLCGTGINLQVHHISYEHLRQPEEIDDLVTLCRSCHSHVHKNDLPSSEKMKDDTQELKRCPFCGGEAFRCHHDLRHYVKCSFCGCGTGVFFTPELAVQAWNRRFLWGA